MALHLGTLPWNLRHTVVVGAIQLLQLELKIVSLTCKLLSDAPDILNLSVVLKSYTVEIRDLLFEVVDFLMSLELLLLKLWAQSQLFLEVCLDFITHVALAITFSLESS